MPRRDDDPNFVEAVARGLDVIAAFEPGRPRMSLSEVATATGLARPTARRILLTLESLGHVRSRDGAWSLTPRVLDLGMRYVQSLGLWDVARSHLEDLVARTGESSSIAQLDGSDIVYVARVAVPKIIALQVSIGTRFPAPQTSMGKVLLAGLEPDELAAVLAQPSRSGVTAHRQPEPDELAAVLAQPSRSGVTAHRQPEPDELAAVLAQPSRSGVTAHWQPEPDELAAVLRGVRAQGWALTDEQLAPGIRSVAAPVRDGDGRVVAAVNVTVHAAETTLATLTEHHLPLLLRTAADISADFARIDALPRAMA
ncbi:IclR family transcriptional regulator domain-containing protein [Aquipuribacter sp. MA13-13]|uniref:IclR family transcriptional regulator domain-containing protein n=1 Tax=Aquipuribacter sp. MA13-13 TaxID=3440840 RepID=UPI003EEBAE02